MKLHIITDQNGEVIATTRAGMQPNGIEVVIKPIVDGHRLYENVEVPDELAYMEVSEFHKRLRKHLPKS
jgi:hypothetical protein